jgi:hypothetical protein
VHRRNAAAAARRGCVVDVDVLRIVEGCKE